MILSGYLFPPNLISIAFPLQMALVIRALFCFLLAGLGTYALARSYGLDTWAAFFSAVSFMLSGYVVAWLGYAQGHAGLMLPLCLFTCENLFKKCDLSGHLRAAAGCALVNGTLLLAGHLQVAVLVLLFEVIYVGLRAYCVGPSTAKHLTRKYGWLLLAWGLSVGVAAPQLAPFLQWLSLSAEWDRRVQTGVHWFYPGFWRDAFSWALLVLPNIFGNPRWPFPYRPFLPGANNYFEWAVYTGVLALTLAVTAALTQCRVGGRVKMWTLIAAGALLLIARFPVVDWFHNLPLLRLMTPGRERVILCLAISLLGGLSFQAILDAEEARRIKMLRLWARLSMIVALCGVMLAVSGTWVLPALRKHLVEWGIRLAEKEYGGQNMDYHIGQVARMADGIVWAFSIRNIQMYFPIWIAFIVAGAAAIATRVNAVATRALMKTVVPLIACVDMFFFAFRAHPLVEKSLFYPETPVTRWLRQDASMFRIAARDRDMIPDIHIIYGLSDIRGIDLLTRWYDKYMSLVPGRDRLPLYGLFLKDIDSPLVRVLNVKYFLSSCSNTVPDAHCVLEAPERGGVNIWELNRVQPRSFMVYQSQVVRNDDEAERLLAARPELVYDTVLLAADHGIACPLELSDTSEDPAHSVRVERYENTLTQWHVETEEDGYLVTTDAFYPGWKAYMDGKEVPLYRANLAFRAVFVPAGRHTIEHRFESAAHLYGFIVGCTSLVVVGALFTAGNCLRKEASAHA